MKLGLSKVPNFAAKFDHDFFTKTANLHAHHFTALVTKKVSWGPWHHAAAHPATQHNWIIFSARRIAAKVKRVIVIFCKVQNLHSLAGKQPKFSNRTRIKRPLSRLWNASSLFCAACINTKKDMCIIIATQLTRGCCSTQSAPVLLPDIAASSECIMLMAHAFVSAYNARTLTINYSLHILPLCNAECDFCSSAQIKEEEIVFSKSILNRMQQSCQK